MTSTSKLLVSLVFAVAALAAPQRAAVIGTVFQIDPDLGACGWKNTSAQAVGAVSATTFHSYPGATANPNKNPICHHNMNITANGITVVVQIVDYFKEDPNAGPNDVGIPVPQFVKMAPVRDGIIEDATWIII
ncbi:hypothetical protein B0H15DRAFT_861506 [Mycena belliarum]|uniref:Uncharacterized protein n=1 Tax=Mycena belliarum TaxID=1033014 RepID=A0AAD6TTH5_9AGAR|nr:hypothetical protein B0H15DRAFT_861506 [Mycena belliae]